MELKNQRLQEILQYGYRFDFGDYFSRGFDIFKKNIGGFVGFTALYFLINSFLNFIPVINIFASIFIMPVLVVGFYMVAYKLNMNQPTEFGDFFKGFDHFGSLVALTLVTTLIYIILLVPIIVAAGVGMMGFFDNSGLEFPFEAFMADFPWWSLILLAPIVYFGVSWTWAPFFVVFYKMGFWEAMETSRKIIQKNWFVVFGFLIVVGLLAIAGIIAFFVGILFSLPAAMCVLYAAFADVTNLTRETEMEDNIASHLVE